MKNPVSSSPLRGRCLPWLGRDDDGALFYATHPDPTGLLTWRPLETWRWRQRRRILQDLREGKAWYLYRLSAATAQPAAPASPHHAGSTAPRPVHADAVGSRRA